MSKSYVSNTARSTFGVFKQPQDAGYYILNKKAKTTFCNPNICAPNKKINTQENLNLLRTSKRLFYRNFNFNKSNLNINLITALDLNNVCAIKNSTTNMCPTTLETYPDSQVFYPFLTYTIDPNGQLFGNTPCGFYNFNNYRVCNLPNPVKIPTYINNI